MSSVGPVPMPVVLILVCVLLAMAVAHLWPRRKDGMAVPSAASMVLDMLLIGLLCGRISFVALNFALYREAPWSILQIADGGYHLAVVLVAGLASGTFQIGAPSPISVLAILELGFAGSALTYLLFFHFIHLWGSTAASLNTYFQPLVGVTLGVLVLGDRVSPSGWLSLATVLCGVIIFGAGSLRSLLRKPAATVVPCDCSIPNRSFCGDRK